MSYDWDGPVTVDEMYGEWDYESAKQALGRSLDPRPGTSFLDTIGELDIGEGDVVLDIGGREGRDCLDLAERFGCRGVSVDPVAANIDRGREIAGEHEFGHLVELRVGAIEAIPAGDNTFDLVISRDMMGHIADLDVALAESRRVLRPDGAVVLHEVFATAMLEPEEARLVCAYTATVPDRLSVATFERVVRNVGFTVQHVDVIGSEWAESSQERGVAPNYLLQIARLRRARSRLIDELGEVPYRVMYGSALWSIYQLIGKLESRVYVLR